MSTTVSGLLVTVLSTAVVKKSPATTSRVPVTSTAVSGVPVTVLSPAVVKKVQPRLLVCLFVCLLEFNVSLSQ